MNDVAGEVQRRAAGLCEYCHIPQAAFRRPFHIEHVIARQHGGASQLDNLALACWSCNLKKGPNLTGIDPLTRQIIPLFNPRRDRWAEHFALSVGTSLVLGIEIKGLTAVGRATVVVLGMNTELRQMVRYQLWREGTKF
ncbi:MAG TPA: HNH endonuclease signature motif containing protein [Bryobacteraceae bacterium]|nr:HNH endonuclease signature motif containing protein [Bryobacteraceae bacterium]